MKQQLQKKLHLFLLIGVLLICCDINVFASHIIGMDLKYTYISDNTYQITLIAYGDCGSKTGSAFQSLPTSSPEISIFDGNTYIHCLYLNIIPPDTGENIAKYIMCPSDTNNTNCSNTGSSITGVKKFIYTGNYTLPNSSHNWRFVFDGNMGPGINAGRANSITNLGTGTSTQLEDSLDNTLGNNSSPNLSLEPILFFCLNNPDTYNPVAIDPDGDSLRFFLIAAIDGSSSPCTTDAGPYTAAGYLGGYSGTNPLSVTAGSFAFDHATGQINFTPNAIQHSTVVYNIREFRDGNFIGTSQREMNFIVMSCSNTPPSATISGAVNGTISADSTHFNVCQNAGTCSFSIIPHEPDTSRNIKVNAIGLPPGLSWAVVGDSTNSPVVTVVWNTTGVAAGAYTFYLQLRDDNCPINGENVIAFTINVIPFSATITGITTICQGSTTTLNTSVGGGIWSSTNTSVAGIGSGSGVVSGINSGTSEIFYVDATGACKDSTNITVNTIPNPISGTSNVCIGSTGTLIETIAGGTWIQSNPIINISSTSPYTETGLSIGIDTITYLLADGCETTFIVTVNPGAAITGPDSFCIGGNVNFTVSNSGGSWSQSLHLVTITGAGTYNVIGIASGIDTMKYILPTGCTSSIIVTVNPTPTIIGSDSVCLGNSVNYTSSLTGGTWKSVDTNVATITTTSGLFLGKNVGTTKILYTSAIPGCNTSETITINPVPAPIIGNSQLCNGFIDTLTDSSSGGTWKHTNTSVLFSTSSGIVTGNVLGIDTIIYQIQHGCFSYKVITVNPIPVITGSDSGCTSNTSILSVTPGGGTWVSTNPSIASITATGANTGSAVGINPGRDTLIYTSEAGCIRVFPFIVNLAVFTHISISDTPSTTQCFGTPVHFSSTYTNAGTIHTLQWTVNGTNAGTGDTFNYIPNNGEVIQCLLNSDTTCATPNPNPSNTITMSVIKHTPDFIISSLLGDTTCIGLPNTYFIANAVDTGTAPQIDWMVDLTPVATGTTNYTYTPANGDIITCKMTIFLQCALPDPKIVSDTAVVYHYQTPSLSLVALPSDAVCQGNPITLTPAPIWGGWGPKYYWNVNGMYIDSTTPFTYFPNNGDTVSCVMISNYLCPKPSDTAISNIGIAVDPVIIVNITSQPGILTTIGQPDTLTATVVNGGYAPTYQWSLNGAPIFGATFPTFIYNGFTNKDSISCMVTTGYGTPCEGIQGFNWVILAVAPLAVNQPLPLDLSDIKVVPNPNTGNFNIEGKVGLDLGYETNLTITIKDVIGRRIYTKPTTTKNGYLNETISLDKDLPNGVYMLQVIGSGGTNVVRFILGR